MTQNKPYLLSVDPGKTGAAALYTPDMTHVFVVRFNKYPSFERALTRLRDEAGLNPVTDRTLAVIEKAQASPQMGVSSAFSYGHTYAETKAMMRKVFLSKDNAFLYGLAEVPPSQWKPAMNLSRDKKASVDMAQSTMPETSYLDSNKMTHDMAEALLLGGYYHTVLVRKGMI